MANNQSNYKRTSGNPIPFPLTRMGLFQQPVKFYGPAGVDVEAWLRTRQPKLRPQALRIQPDKYYYIIHLLYEHAQQGWRGRQEGYRRLSSRVIRPLLGERYVAPILNDLEARGVIERDNEATWNPNLYKRRSMGYRLTEAYRSARPVVYNVTSMRLSTKLREQQAEQEERNEAKGGYLYQNLKAFKLDPAAHEEAKAQLEQKVLNTYAVSSLAEAEQREATIRANKQALTAKRKSMRDLKYAWALAQQTGRYSQPFGHFLRAYRGFVPEVLDVIANQYTLEQYWAACYLLGQLEQGPSGRLIRDKYGRVHTVITNFPKELRPVLTHRDYPQARLFNIDIKNSQPLLLSVLLLKEYKGRRLPTDVRCYIELTQAGTLYEELMNAHNIPTREREAFKRRLFAEVFYGENKYRSPAKTYFATSFPKVAAFIKRKKRPNYRAFSREMQRVESRLIIDQVGASLHKRGIWFSTIHDSVVCLLQDAKQARDIIKRRFQVVGLEPSLKITPLRSRATPGNN